MYESKCRNELTCCLLSTKHSIFYSESRLSNRVIRVKDDVKNITIKQNWFWSLVTTGFIHYCTIWLDNLWKQTSYMIIHLLACKNPYPCRNHPFL